MLSLLGLMFIALSFTIYKVIVQFIIRIFSDHSVNSSPTGQNDKFDGEQDRNYRVNQQGGASVREARWLF